MTGARGLQLIEEALTSLVEDVGAIYEESKDAELVRTVSACYCLQAHEIALRMVQRQRLREAKSVLMTMRIVKDMWLEDLTGKLDLGLPVPSCDQELASALCRLRSAHISQLTLLRLLLLPTCCGC